MSGTISSVVSACIFRNRSTEKWFEWIVGLARIMDYGLAGFWFDPDSRLVRIPKIVEACGKFVDASESLIGFAQKSDFRAPQFAKADRIFSWDQTTGVAALHALCLPNVQASISGLQDTCFCIPAFFIPAFCIPAMTIVQSIRL